MVSDLIGNNMIQIDDIIDLEDGIRGVRKAIRKAYNALVAGDLGSARVLLGEVDQAALDALGKSAGYLEDGDLVGLDGNRMEPTCCGRLKPRR